MNRVRKSLFCLLLLSAVAPAAGKVESFRLDPVHSRVLFRVDHAGFSQALGVFPDVRGELHFDSEDWTSARLEVQVPLAGLEIGDADWRDKLLSATWLHARRQPVAHFRSTRVEPTGKDRARVTGELTLKGETREVALDVRMNKLARNPVTFRRTAGFSATAELDRRDFDMPSWPNVVGQRVQLDIQAEAVRYRPSTEPESDDADPQHD
ncbi:YceI family protein [Arenimonas sp.]|uniref:YceI family protein n=1 Tax=Arenimonas sp. TaxID=1872635 RepID=UPI0035B459D4